MAALSAKVLRKPLVSNKKPPIVAPSVMASCMTATIRPPPASASLGRVLLSQVPHPTGAGVPTSPQHRSNIALAIGQRPSVIKAMAIEAIASGMAINTVYKRVLNSAPIKYVPTNPATPRISRMSDRVGTFTPVTVSRKGRR
jgi:hypothetical protein